MAMAKISSFQYLGPCFVRGILCFDQHLDHINWNQHSTGLGQWTLPVVIFQTMLGDDHTRHFCANYGGSARKQKQEYGKHIYQLGVMFLNFGGPAPQNGAFQWLHGLVMSTTSISTNLLAPLAELNLLPLHDNFGLRHNATVVGQRESMYQG
jgi:hypothetical protein